MQRTNTATQRLASVILGQDLGEWVAERRAHPYEPSWQAIADELREVTDNEVDVSRETLRLWYGQRVAGEPTEKSA